MVRASKYLRVFQMGIDDAIYHRFELFAGLFTAALPVVIQFFVWRAVFASTNRIAAYSEHQLLAYAMIAAIVGRIVATGFEYEIVEDIKNGGLNVFLTQPIRYLPLRLAKFIGQKVSILLLAFVLIGLALWGYDLLPAQLFEFAWRLISGFTTVILGTAINFCLFTLLGLLAFWLTEVSFSFEAVRITTFVLSGGVFPLEVLALPILAFVSVLPFELIIRGPTDIFIGYRQGADVLGLIARQAIWVLVLTGLITWLWQRGLRRHVAAGG